MSKKCIYFIVSNFQYFLIIDGEMDHLKYRRVCLVLRMMMMTMRMWQTREIMIEIMRMIILSMMTKNKN